MNLRQIKLASLIAGLSILSAVISLIFVNQADKSLATGHLYISEKIFKDVSEIQISGPSVKVTFIPEEHLWRIKEADYYYADFNLMHNILNSLKSARIINKQPLTTTRMTELGFKTGANSQENTFIQIKDKKGREIEHIIFGSHSSDKEATFLKRPTEDAIYTVNKYINFPETLSSWLQQPLVSIEERNIQQFSLNQIQYSRKDKSQAFTTSSPNKLSAVKITQILQKFKYLSYEEVVSAQNFDDTLYPHRAEIVLTDFSGLVRHLEILTDNSTYWLRQTFSTTPLPTRETNDYIKNNSFLYDGWYFKVSPQEGKRLYTYANG